MPPASSPAVPSLAAGQGAIGGSTYIAMITGDLFGTGHSRFVIQPESYVARGPAFVQTIPFYQERGPLTTGLSVVNTPRPGVGMQLGASSNPAGTVQPSELFPTGEKFETKLGYNAVVDAFNQGTTSFELQENAAVNQRVSTQLNVQQQYAPGHVYGGGVIAPGGPDFQTHTTTLTADFAAHPGPLPSANQQAPLVFDPNSDTFDVNAVFGSSPLVQFNPAPIILASLPGGTLGSAPGDNVGRVKLAENVSPIPRDRVYVNYSYFDQARVTPNGLSVNRVTPGVEKTFLDGNASVEFRAPFATTLDSTVISGGTTNTNATEFGNAAMFLKALLWNNDAFGVSAGCGVSAPTAEDFRVRDASTGNTILEVQNRSPHVLPFLGALYAPDDRLFAQGLMQFDLDTVGNPVSLSSYSQGGPTGTLTGLGRAHDANYVFLGGNVGYWIYQGTTPSLPFTGLSPFAEVHYNQTLSRGDRVAGVVPGAQFDSGPTGQLQLVNAVVGLNATMQFGGMLTLAYATPVGGGRDQQYNGEFRVLYNVLFGAQNRFTRAQF